MSDKLTRKQNQRLRKLKKKIYKLNYLNEELEDTIKTVDEYSQEFNEALRKWFQKHDATDAIDDMFPKKSEEEILAELSNSDEIDIKQKNSNIDPWVKEIYRQIANETHPDKVGQIEGLSNNEKIKRNDIFMNANICLQENDGPALYIIAIELNLKMKNIPDNILEHFDKSANDLQEKISNAQNSNVWYWAESSFEVRANFISKISEKYEIQSSEPEIALFLKDYIK